jgi:hypothetical protein
MAASALTAIRVVAGICAAGLALHLYTVFFRAEGELDFEGLVFLVGLLVWSLVPYLVWGSVAVVKRQVDPAIGGAFATLGFDLFMHYSVFVSPTGSTAALGLLFAPFWNLILFGPIGAAVSWLLLSMARRRRNAL